MNKTKTCTDCQSTFQAEVLEINGREVMSFGLCDPCLEKRNEQRIQEEAINSRKAAENEFWQEVPALYQGTDKSRLNANLVAAISRWEYGAKGLGMTGESGAGKTRAAVLLLRRFHPQKSICFLKATRLTKYAAEKFSSEPEEANRAKAKIRQAYNSKILLLDDIGKGRLPATAEELLFDLIDERSERSLPVIWTSNAKAIDLHSAFTNDRADAIIRRLAEFSTIVSV
jgi:DNA replication protein DnaC